MFEVDEMFELDKMLEKSIGKETSAFLELFKTHRIDKDINVIRDKQLKLTEKIVDFELNNNGLTVEKYDSSTITDRVFIESNKTFLSPSDLSAVNDLTSDLTIIQLLELTRFELAESNNGLNPTIERLVPALNALGYINGTREYHLSSEKIEEVFNYLLHNVTVTYKRLHGASDFRSACDDQTYTFMMGSLSSPYIEPDLVDGMLSYYNDNPDWADSGMSSMDLFDYHFFDKWVGSFSYLPSTINVIKTHYLKFGLEDRVHDLKNVQLY